MGEIIDFTEHYMHRLIDKYAKNNDEQTAWALAETLDKYITGEIGILLIEGVPVPYMAASAKEVYSVDEEPEESDE